MDEAAVQIRDRQQLLVLDARAIACGSRRSPHSGEAAVSSYTAMPSVNQRGTRCLVAESTYTWLNSCHMVLAQWKRARLAAGRAVHRDDVAEGHAQRAQARHAHGADGEIFVVGIDLQLHRTGRACSLYFFS